MNKSTAPIPFAGSHLDETRHVCAFFNSDEEEYQVLLPFIEDGFVCGCEIGIFEGELIDLLKSDVHPEDKPDSWGHYGYIHIRKGKTAFRRRNLPITERVREILKTGTAKSKSALVFTGTDDKCPISNFYLIHQQAEMRTLLKLPEDAVIHSSRHTALTNLGLAGADVFSLQQAAGHASIQTTRKYVHPIPESTSAAFQKKSNQEKKKARGSVPKAFAMSKRPSKPLPIEVWRLA